MVCHCAPQWCHGQVLAAVLRSEPAEVMHMMRGAQEMTRRDEDMWVEGRERGLAQLQAAAEHEESEARLAEGESSKATGRAERRRAESMRAAAEAEEAVQEQGRARKEYERARGARLAADVAKANERLAMSPAGRGKRRAGEGEDGGRGRRRISWADGWQGRTTTATAANETTGRAKAAMEVEAVVAIVEALEADAVAEVAAGALTEARALQAARGSGGATGGLDECGECSDDGGVGAEPPARAHGKRIRTNARNRSQRQTAAKRGRREAEAAELAARLERDMTGEGAT